MKVELGIIWSGRILVSYLNGSLMDKMGRRPILILGGIMAAISMVALGVFFSFTMRSSALVSKKIS